MNRRQIKRPSPALVVATVALFVALGGTAGAVVTAAVPLAKRALVADNAKKVGGTERRAARLAGVSGPWTGQHGCGARRHQVRHVVPCSRRIR